MSVTRSHKMLCAASAASLSAMGFLMFAAPVGASPMRPLDPPTGCDSYTMPAGLIIKQSDGTVITVNNGAGADLSGAQASYTTNGKVTTGSAHGGSAGGVNLNFSIDWNAGPGAGATTTYTGVVTKAGNGQGNTSSTKGPSLVWSTSPQTFGCVMNNPAPAQPVNPNTNNNPGPVTPPPPIMTVTPVQKQDGSALDFTVTNNSAQDLQCKYTATKVAGANWLGGGTQSFTLKAGASTTLEKKPGLPAVPKTTYKVNISCDGLNGGQTFEQNFSG